jgi:hypothetical protein
VRRISSPGSRSRSSELRLSLDPTVEAPTAIAPLIDPNVHSGRLVFAVASRRIGLSSAMLAVFGLGATSLLVLTTSQGRIGWSDEFRPSRWFQPLSSPEKWAALDAKEERWGGTRWS